MSTFPISDMPSNCYTYKSHLQCKNGLLNVDGRCVCHPKGHSNPFVQTGIANTVMAGTFKPFIPGSEIPISSVTQQLIRERDSVVTSGGGYKESYMNRVPTTCSPFWNNSFQEPQFSAFLSTTK